MNARNLNYELVTTEKKLYLRKIYEHKNIVTFFV